LPGMTINLPHNGYIRSYIRYEWTRDPPSLAAGKVVGTSDAEAKLMLVNLVPGQYYYTLKVWDDQGKFSSDKVSFVVREDPDKINVIRAVLNKNVSVMSLARLEETMRGLEMLLHARSAYRIKVREVRAQDDTGESIAHDKNNSIGPILDNALVDFIVTTSDPALTAAAETQQKKLEQKRDEKLQPPSDAFEGEDRPEVVASGKKVVQELQAKLRQDSELLSLSVLSLDTVVCQNDCSGHGKCHQATRSCICEPFWLENFVRRHLMDGKSNCGEANLNQ